MSEINNKKYHKEIESEICLDEIMMNNKFLQKNQNSNSNDNNNINNNKNNTNPTNILLNSLQDFFNRYEKDDRKILSNKKFIISFKEIISLIRESMIAQQQIDNIIYTNKDYTNKNNSNINIQKINQKYINDLSYNIFSFDKIDIGYGFNLKKKKKINSNISPNNIKFQNNSKLKKSYNPPQQVSISPNNIKKEINSIFENIYKEVFMNGINPLENISKKNENENKITNKKKGISKSKNIRYERNKSELFDKKYISPLRYNKISKTKNENKKLNNTVINNINNNISYNNNNININNNNISSLYKSYGAFSANKSNYSTNRKLRKSKTFKTLKKNSNKNELKCSDIFLACENINMIKNSGNKKCISRSNNYFSNDLKDNDSFLKKSLKSVGISDIYNSGNYSDVMGYEELKLNSGIKKIIVSNTHKPSSLANKLLISGHKYIDDFKEINEGAKKKNV